MLLRDLLEEWYRKMKMVQKHYGINKAKSFVKEENKPK